MADMTAAVDRPLRARACIRAMIYRVEMRAKQTPPYHPLRLQLEDELAELNAQLADVEQCVSAVAPLKPSRLAAPSEPAPLCGVSHEAIAVDVSDVACKRDQETDLSWTPHKKDDPGDALQARLAASSAAKERQAPLGPLNGARASSARAAAAIFTAMRRMLETVGESVIAFAVIVLGATVHCIRYVQETFCHCAVVAEQIYRRSLVRIQHVMDGGSRRLRRRIGKLTTHRDDFLAFITNILRRSGDRLGTLLGSCAGAAANQRRPLALSRGSAARKQFSSRVDHRKRSLGKQ
jgi:hypothetical protein